MHDTQAAEVAVFGAERAVDDIHLLNQLGAERLQRPEIPLTMALGALILLDIVHQDLETAIHASVVEVEAKAPDLQRLATAFMLPRANAGAQLLKHLIV